VADYSLSSRTWNLSISAKWVAYDFCASRVGRYVKRKLRLKSNAPSLLSPTSAIPCPASEGGSMTIAKGRVSIFTFSAFLGFGWTLIVPLSIAAEIDGLAALHC
jgi:hypothetical protein